MKNLFTCIALATFLSGFSQKKQDIDKQSYINEFKMVYFCDCLKHGFNNSNEILKILKIDGSTNSELILGNSYLLIDSLAIRSSQKIVHDSIQFSAGRAEGGKGKQVFSECLLSYDSKWLKDLAEKEYKKSIRN